MGSGTCFGGYDDVVAFPAKFLDSFTHDLFAFSSGIPFSTVEEVDSDVICGFHTGKCVLYDEVRDSSRAN